MYFLAHLCLLLSTHTFFSPCYYLTHSVAVLRGLIIECDLFHCVFLQIMWLAQWGTLLMRSHFKNKFKSAHISGLVHLFSGEGGSKFSVKGPLQSQCKSTWGLFRHRISSHCTQDQSMCDSGVNEWPSWSISILGIISDHLIAFCRLNIHNSTFFFLEDQLL